MRTISLLGPLLAVLLTALPANAGEDAPPPVLDRVPLMLPQVAATDEPASAPTTPPAGAIHAARARRAPVIDGRLDDPAWADAPVFDGFVLNQPTEGGAGSERTELRVLFDDDHLYVGFRCVDSQPGTINRSLARRDDEPASDYVALFVSAGNDGRTARRFYLNAAGVQADTLIYDDIQWSQSWDAVWDGAVAVSAEGWSAEYAIPLHVLGVDARQATWGLLARRYIARTHELVSAPLVPRAANGFVSYFGGVDGVEAIAPQRAVELVPYLASRAVIRPMHADPSRPTDRMTLGSADLGANLALYPGHGLLLNATLNPDFGEVQPDSIILNVSSFETYYPELRPFFTQGMDAFLTVGGMDQDQAMFYSRRIGLAEPILAAAKLTGRPTPGLSIGLLDAVVDGPYQAAPDEDHPDGSVAFHPERPFHLGPTDELPANELVPENFVAATARATLGGSSYAGGRFSAATPLDGPCTDADRARPTPPARCTTYGVNAFGGDFNLKTASGDYGVFGQAAVTESVLGAPRTLRDGTTIAPGDTGAGGFVRAGKLGGEGLRLQLGYDYAAPTFDLNAIGFQHDSNVHDSHLDVGVSYPNGVGPLLSLDAWLHGDLAFSADGRALRRNASASFEINALLPGFHRFYLTGMVNDPGYDIRELRGTGTAMNQAGIAYTRATFDTDGNQPLSWHGLAALGYHRPIGPTPRRFDWTFETGATWRPMPALQTQLTATLDRTLFDPRMLEQLDASHFLMGTLDLTTLTVTLRQDWVLTRRLTLQAYLQLFSAYGSFGPFYTGQGTPDQPLLQQDLVAAAMPGVDPSFHAAELIANLVGRWEYRPGSTLFLVYSRTQNELPPMTADGHLGVSRLFSGAAVDLFLVKWAQWLAF